MDKRTLEQLKRMADAIVAVFGSTAEVVVHDLSDIEHSVVHMAGNVTGRELGAPISHFPYRIFKEQGDAAEDVLGYRNVTRQGRVMKCSTVFVRDDHGKVVACFSINQDVSDYIRLNSLLAEKVEFATDPTSQREMYTTTFPETVETLIEGAIADLGKPPSDMDKDDRVKVVGSLERAGVFMYKGAVQQVANLLGTSRYTIYGYLREAKGD